MKQIISYFTSKHLTTNILFFGILSLSIFVWNNIGKEEMPEFSFDWIRIQTIYPGASSEDVELLVTRSIEKELKTVSGLDEVHSTSAQGNSIIMAYYDPALPDIKEIIQEIKDATLRASLPVDVRDIPSFKQFKSTDKAIMDIAIIHKHHDFLTTANRRELQQYSLSLENQLIANKEITSLSKAAYLHPEIRLEIDPKKMMDTEIDLSTIKNQIQAHNIRIPVGALSDSAESRITALNELETPGDISNVILQGNYQGNLVKLKNIGTVKEEFRKNIAITKVNGKEAIILKVQKSLSTDIITAQKVILKTISNFKKSNIKSPVEIITMDDESFSVTNRLKIITSNGLIGFALLITVLFIFLNFKTGFWVAMGIPFSISFTLIVAYFLGHSVNNMTLAAVIIVLGVVVDDAIIIAENIMRKIESGIDQSTAALTGTLEMLIPILGSIATTIAAFIPLLFFNGHFGKLVVYIPVIITLMLVGSLIESIFILPSHLIAKTPFTKKNRAPHSARGWFIQYENLYKKTLIVILQYRLITLSVFSLLLVIAAYVFTSNMKFVMFPREESTEVMIKVKAPKNTPREQTARMISKIEHIFLNEKNNVVAVRSMIAKSRRGGEVKENEATIIVELLPADQRQETLNMLFKKWKKQTKELTEFKMIKFLRGRWGNSSGSPIEIRIQENNNIKRFQIADSIQNYLRQKDYLEEVEIEQPLVKNEYLFHLNQENLIRFNITPSRVTDILRTFVEGTILYTINKGEEEVDVRLTVPEQYKTDIKSLLSLKVENRLGKLIPLHKIITTQQLNKPTNIKRVDFKRTTMVYADLKSNTSITPLNIAKDLEDNLFPKLYSTNPTSIISFVGEIKNSRESQNDFKYSIILVCLLIYTILVLIFNSLTTPFMILAIIPFGLAGVIFVLQAHSMNVYGFFAVIGTLGMMGVVINDAIVMVSKFEKANFKDQRINLSEYIAQIAATRLRPVLLTTITTVAGIVPTAYGWSGYDSMLAEMMITLGWGLTFGTLVTLILVPIFYTFLYQIRHFITQPKK